MKEHQNSAKDLYLSFGSNIGDSKELILRAIFEVAENPGIIYLSHSSFWLTEPLYDSNQAYFTNAVAKYRCNLSPYELLDFLHGIEKRFLRQRDPLRPNGPRTLDIDILFYGDLQIRESRLSIPHPRFHERKFILFPMAEIDVHYRVPGSSLEIGDYIQSCPDNSKVERI